MIDVHLHGFLGEKYGSKYRLEIASAPEAVRALEANFPGFMEDMRHRWFRVVRGNPDTGLHLDGDLLGMHLGNADLHFIPTTAGAKSSGAKAVIGVVILGAAVVASGGLAAGATLFGANGALAGTAFGVGAATVSYGNLAMLGFAVALGGITTMLSPTPKADYSSRDTPDQRPSFLYNGPVNTVEQGGPVPLVYGIAEVGSTVVSGSIETEQI